MAGLRATLRSPPLVLLAAATAITVALGWLLRARCVGLSDMAFGGLDCYSDLGFLHRMRGLDADLVPYLQAFNEYPPLTAAVQWLGALLSDGERGFFAATALLLAPCAFAVTWMLGRAGEPRAWAWALGPSLFLYAFLNWDLFAVALCTAGLLAFRRDRQLAAGLLLGLAFSAKWYPAVLGVVLAAALLGQDRRLRSPRLLRFVGAAAAGAVVPHLIVLALSPQGLADAYGFHLRRLPNGDSLRFLVSFYAERWGVQDIVAFDGLWGAALNVALVGGVGWAAWQAYRGRLPPLQAAFLALLVFLACNKVYSPQYALWLLPFFVLLRVPWVLVGLFWVADLVAMLHLYHAFPADPAEFPARYPLFAVWNALRWLALLAILAWALRRPAAADAPAQAPRPWAPEAPATATALDDGAAP
ncbi:MAG: hypothetical protein QOD77_477 [Thermoplasmata archaeon]|jgi:uncharacterized membrane protein|nr:hypothetical protein [Thermoplasmata archaeon]